jgi:hypothetical protein
MDVNIGVNPNIPPSTGVNVTPTPAPPAYNPAPTVSHSLRDPFTILVGAGVGWWLGNKVLGTVGGIAGAYCGMRAGQMLVEGFGY